MTHLGTQLSALADGRLAGAARERALCHVAACGPCADELAAIRAARRALAAACDVPPAPDLTPRLLALGSAAACGPVHGDAARSLGGGPVLDVAPVLGGGFGTAPWDEQPSFGRPHLRSAAVLTVGAAVVGLFLLGDAGPVSPDSHPADDLALLASAGSATGTLAALSSGTDVTGAPGATEAAATGVGVDPAAVDAVWPGGALPEGFVVLATHTDASRTELDLDGPAGPVVVLRQTGRLSGEVVADAPVAVIGEHEVRVLSDAPWHAVWQSGDAVVGVVAAHRSSAVDDLVAAYPEQSADDGLGARVSRGWQTVVGAWAP